MCAHNLIGSVIYLILLISSSESVHLTSREISANVSALLQSLLDNKYYDRRIRPGIGGPPIEVSVNMYIKSLGPVYEDESKYSMDIYFRQTWYDTRLAFNMPGMTELTMSWLFFDKIWKPDTYFVNGKKSHLHRITSPNKFVRVRNDGYLTSSMRLTLTASCKMHLKKFPLDSQSCHLVIGSYAYASQDLLYKWDMGGVKLEPGVGMAQYHVTNITIKGPLLAQRAQGQFSVIMANFHLRRSTGYYMLQIYVPCCLIVCCSWIAFWITPNDAAGRTSLGATTVLSITTLGFGGRANLPKVSHATALDWFVIICFSFAFISLMEFAAISFMAKLMADLKKLKEEEEEKEKDAQKEQALAIDLHDSIQHIDEEEGNAGIQTPQIKPKDITPGSILGSVCPSSRGNSPIPWYRRAILLPIRYYQKYKGDEEEKKTKKDKPPKEANKLDNIARILFPVCFITILTTYAILYTYYIKDKEPDDDSVMGFFKVD